jgi:predicted lipoprotein with Yx(FWY)xxD motif
MRRSFLLPILLAATTLLVAACGSSDDNSSASSAATAGGLVSLATVDGTDVLADSAGKTLYTAPVEKAGKILCVDTCTSFWDPVLGTSSDAEQAAGELDADLGVVERPDGGSQLTFDGLPLYTFTEEGSGKLQGDGFVDVFQGTRFEWQAARTSGTAAPSSDNGSGGGYGY